MIYYFVSDNLELHNMTICPRIPTHRISSEDSSTLRICVSQSINGCLTAIEPTTFGKTYYVYQCESNEVIQPTIDQVPDVYLTGEIWITEPVKLTFFRKIVLTGCIDHHADEMSNAQYSFRVVDIGYDAEMKGAIE